MSNYSQIVLNNNKNSIILERLKNYKCEKRDLSYLTCDNIQNNYKCISEIKPQLSPTLPSSTTSYKYKINGSGFIRKAMIKTVLKKGSVDHTTPNMEILGAKLYKNIYILQNGNKVLTYNNIGSIINRISETNSTIQSYYTSITSSDWEEVVADTEYKMTIYTPIFSYYFDHACNNILLDMSSDIEIIAEYNEDLTFDPVLTSFTPTLQLFTMSYEDIYINSYKANLYKTPKLNYLTYDNQLSKYTISENSTEYSFDIQYKLLLQVLHMTLIDYNNGAIIIPINSVSIKLGDKYIVENVDNQMNVANTDWGVDEITDSLISVNGLGLSSFSYFFGNKRRMGTHSGSLDLSMAPITVTIKFDALTNDTILYVNLEHLSMTFFDTKLGKYDSAILH